MLFIKLLRDIKKSLLSTITIVIIISLGIMLWAGFNAVSTNLAIITDDFYARCAMPDLFITGTGLTRADMRELEREGADIYMGGPAVVI